LNIFYIDENPQQAAEWMVDKHVVKMILESAQLLSTAHRVLDGKKEIKIINNRKKTVYTLYDERDTIMYQATHINHPSAIWTRTSLQNYDWLVEHFFALCQEYKYRYNKTHKCFAMGYYLQSPPKNLTDFDMTPMPNCMPEEYKKSESVINNYRMYYKYGKKELHNWKKRNPPEWI
jgi:hypothetical protein